MPFNVGENLGPYRVVQQLGQGGMATVFRAYHAALDRYVAIKVLHPAFTQDPNFLARFQREAKVVARLEHPNIVPVYDFSEHEGKPYLVMKFIQGETLKARMGRGPVSVKEGLRVVEAVGSALSYAHQQGVLHRDIKPSNVLLGADGTVYLADFGLARIASAGESTLSSDMLLGTPQYISPEQARGDRNLDAGTDIYSLGVVLYELVVGRVPFNADTPFSIIHDHIFTPLPLPTKVNPLVPEMVERVLLKALAKERGDRFASVEALVGAFRDSVATQAGRPEPAPRPPWPPTVPSEVATAATGADAPDAPKTGELEAGKKPRLSKRGWIAIFGVGLSLCACLAALALASGAWEAELSGVTAQPELPTQALAPLEDAAEAARRAVAKDPENPALRLELSAALLENDQPRLAYAEFVKAGNLFLAQGRHADAAAAYLQALSLPGEAGSLAGAEVVERTEQALFLAAPEARALELLQEARAVVPDWPTLPILEARAQLFAGQPEVAAVLTSQVLEQRPEDPLARAVRIEQLIQNGAVEEARVLTKETLLQEDLPLWLRQHLVNLTAGLENP
ncbi:MAG: protein kinase [Anaerolineales bacterium]|nr:protein kinase [Anaerolineales bacterium]